MDKFKIVPTASVLVLALAMSGTAFAGGWGGGNHHQPQGVFSAQSQNNAQSSSGAFAQGGETWTDANGYNAIDGNLQAFGANAGGEAEGGYAARSHRNGWGTSESSGSSVGQMQLGVFSAPDQKEFFGKSAESSAALADHNGPTYSWVDGQGDGYTNLDHGSQHAESSSDYRYSAEDSWKGGSDTNGYGHNDGLSAIQRHFDFDPNPAQ